MKTVAIIDYGMGNLHSVSKAVEHVAPDVRVHVTADPGLIREADRVILPGVGAIRDCMAEIRRLQVDELVREVAQDRPLLGICVGMQALMAHSEENNGVDCIGLLPGEVRFFGHDLHEGGERLKVPHMGWNQVSQAAEHPLWHDIEDGERFYFVHSYYVDAAHSIRCGWPRPLRRRAGGCGGPGPCFRDPVPPREEPPGRTAAAAQLCKLVRRLSVDLNSF